MSWTARNDEELERCINGSMSNATIAARLHIDEQAVLQRIAERGLKRPRVQPERRAR